MRRADGYEKTLLIVKPDGVPGGWSERAQRVERKGYTVKQLQAMHIKPRARRKALRRAQGQAVVR